MGAEPVFDPAVVAQPDKLMDAYTWYNTNYEYADSRRFLVSYLKGIKVDKDVVSKVADLPITYHTTTVGWVARIVSRGAILNLTSQTWFDQQVQSIISDASSFVQSTIEGPRKMTIQDRMHAQYDTCVAEIDGMIDDFSKSNPGNFKELLSKMSLSAPVAKKVADHYKPLAREYEEVIVGSDPQLKEAYSNVSRTEVKAIKAFVDGIIAELGNETYKAKMIRKPRKARIVPATKQVSKMKFMLHCAEPQLRSVPPEGIIGASQLWVYNVKKRKLGVYHSESAGGLRVKGSSILAFDPKTSVAKKLRKPEKVLATVTQGGKVALRSVLDDVRAVASELNGRINGDTILVRVVK
jgi:hypothetical protein